jgi:peptidyl-prolyl cis-trans isomerase B (cyclophilin B)
VRVAATTLLLLAVLGLGACGDDDDGDGTATTAEEPCEEASAPPPKDVKLDPPPSKPSAESLVAVVDTSCGTFEITLDTKGNPKTAASFEYLAENGVFDNTLWHRIVPGFVIQGGDPQGTGEGGPGYSVVEAPPRDLVYEKGVVAMAKTELEERGTSGSQFFVVTAEDAQLPPDYALVGRVTGGEDVVDRIGVVETDPSDAPVDPVVIESVSVEER